LQIEGPDGHYLAKKKEFKPSLVADSLQNLARDFGQDRDDQALILGKCADLYRLTTERFDPEGARPSDHGRLDLFLTDIPEQIRLGLTGKDNSSALFHSLLDIGINLLQQPREYTDFMKQFQNYDLLTICQSLEELTEYLENGGAEEGQEKQRLMHEVEKRSHAEMFGQSPARFASLSGLFVHAKYQSEEFDQPAAALRELDNLILAVSDVDPELLHHLKPQSIHALGKAAKSLAGGSEEEGGQLIREAGKTTVALRDKDKYASHIFCQVGFSSLDEAVGKEKYDLEKASRFLTTTADFLQAANGNKSQSKDAYGEMRAFVNNGYLRILLSVDEEGFSQEVINSISGGKGVLARIARVSNNLDLMRATTIAASLGKEPLSALAQTEFYQQLAAKEKVPFYHASYPLRNTLEEWSSGKLPEETQLATDLREPLLAMTDWCQAASRDDLEVLSFGLGTAFANDNLATLTLSEAAKAEGDEFVGYLSGLGVLRYSWRDQRRFEKKQISDLLEVPQEPEGKTALVKTLGQLSTHYLSSDPAKRKQIHHLVAYTMESDQLRIPFLMHVQAGTNEETLGSLAWICRLADTDDRLDQTVQGFLGQRMTSFSLPSGGKSAQTALVPVAGKEELALEQINNSQPLGAAIQVISEAVRHDPEVMGSVASALGKVELRTVEDAQTLAGPIIGSMAKFLGVDQEVLSQNMVTFRKASEIIDQVYEQNEVAGIIGMVSAITGGGPIPILSYSPARKEIIVNEEQMGGWTVDGLGEEMLHWVRDVVHPTEAPNPVVDEFWGFLGRRIGRQALGIEDVKVDLSDCDRAIDRTVENILGRERYRYLDTGFAARLKGHIEHTVGYAAASNLDLSSLPPNLIQADDDSILNSHIQQYGPSEDWFISLIQRVRGAHRQALRKDQITKRITPIDSVLGPILESLDHLPYLQNKTAVKKAKRAVSKKPA
jgi:hypothetical protein